MSFWRTAVYQTLAKNLDQFSPDLLKVLVNLSDTTVRWSAVEWEDPKQYWKLAKGRISWRDQQAKLDVFQRFYWSQKEV